MFSALGASRGTPALLGAYARFLGDSARRRGVLLDLDLGLERDDVTELAADMWALYDRAAELDDEDGRDKDTESHGEDEE